ncbi:MAG: YHS domain-containing protein [Candidatus Electrothrix sp. YB6]
MSPQRLLLLAVLLYIGWRLVRSLIREKIRQELQQERAKAGQAAQNAQTTVRDVLVEDPVCHTLIPKDQAIRLRQDSKTYYFCSDSCCDQFTGNPGGKE